MSHPTPRYHASLRVPAAVMTIIPRQVQAMVVLLLVAVSLSLFLFVPHTLADEQMPEAPGSIAGVVKMSTGAFQAGIDVTLYQLNTSNDSVWNGIRTITTQTDGKYQFQLLPAGIYRIGTSDPKRVYAPVYYPTAPTLAKGADLSVVGNQLTNIDVTLQPGGQITGVVTLTGSLPITDGAVELYQEVENAGSNTWEVVQRFPLSPTNGIYSFTGLSATLYRICAYASNAIYFAAECYANMYPVDAATSFTLTVGATISNINLALGEGPSVNLSQLGGRVTTLDNISLADIESYASPLALEKAGLISAPTPFSRFSVPSVIPGATQRLLNQPLLYYIRTDDNGNYRFSLPAGRYHLYFRDLSGQYAFEFYNDTVLAESATVVAVAENEVITDINIQLAPASHIHGLITLLGQPAPSGSVYAEMQTAFGWRSVDGDQVEATTGRYNIGGLPAGTYRVRAETYLDSYGDTYIGYWGGNTLETAAPITLTVGVTKSADIALSGGPTFAGAVSGRVTANGAPLAGAKVFLYPGIMDCCSSLLPQPLVYVFTDAEGRYAINGLKTNLYWLSVADPVSAYATTYYPDHAVPASAGSLYIEDGVSFTETNFTMPLAGAISGRVVTAKGKAVPGLSVSVYAADPAFDPGYGSIRLVSSDTTTDIDGHYLVKGLHPAVYYVCFSDTPRKYGECYGGPHLGYSDVGGVPVNVVAGVTKSGIDLFWGPDLPNYLPFIAK